MKGLMASVYCNASGYDCTNGGISSKHDNLVLVGDGVEEIFESRDGMPAIRLILRDVGRFGKFWIAAPLDAKIEGYGAGAPYMFGGNFLYCSDSRFPCDAPIKIFDRLE